MTTPKENKGPQIPCKSVPGPDVVPVFGNIQNAILSAGLASAFSGGGMSTFQEIKALSSGSVSIWGAVLNIGRESVASAIKGAGLVMISEGVKRVGIRVLPRHAASALIRGFAPAAIASCTIELAVDAYSGRLDADRATKTVGRAGSAWLGTEAGALLGSALLPGIGTATGALVGGLIAAFGFDLASR